MHLSFISVSVDAENLTRCESHSTAAAASAAPSIPPPSLSSSRSSPSSSSTATASRPDSAAALHSSSPFEDTKQVQQSQSSTQDVMYLLSAVASSVTSLGPAAAVASLAALRRLIVVPCPPPTSCPHAAALVESLFCHAATQVLYTTTPSFPPHSPHHLNPSPVRGSCFIIATVVFTSPMRRCCFRYSVECQCSRAFNVTRWLLWRRSPAAANRGGMRTSHACNLFSTCISLNNFF